LFVRGRQIVLYPIQWPGTVDLEWVDLLDRVGKVGDDNALNDVLSLGNEPDSRRKELKSGMV